jgi:hypothetical protein
VADRLAEPEAAEARRRTAKNRECRAPRTPLSARRELSGNARRGRLDALEAARGFRHDARVARARLLDAARGEGRHAAARPARRRRLARRAGEELRRRDTGAVGGRRAVRRALRVRGGLADVEAGGGGAGRPRAAVPRVGADVAARHAVKVPV